MSWFFENENIDSKIEKNKTQENCIKTQESFDKDLTAERIDKVLEGIATSENIVNRFLTVIENQQRLIDEQVSINKQYAHQLKDQQEITKNLSVVLAKQNTPQLTPTGKEIEKIVQEDNKPKLEAPKHLRKPSKLAHSR